MKNLKSSDYLRSDFITTLPRKHEYTISISKVFTFLTKRVILFTPLTFWCQYTSSNFDVCTFSNIFYNKVTNTTMSHTTSIRANLKLKLKNNRSFSKKQNEYQTLMFRNVTKDRYRNNETKWSPVNGALAVENEAEMIQD